MARIYTPVVQLTTSPVGQLRLIQNAFSDLKGGTVKEITDHVIKHGLVTKQDPMRVVMFYMIYLGKMKKVKEITEKELLSMRTSVVKPSPSKKSTATKSSPKTSK